MINHQTHQTQINEASLRLQLRGLPKERELERDLWSNIHASIQSSPKKKNHWIHFAAAASFALVTMTALALFSSKQSSNAEALNTQVVTREVKAMQVEYNAALKEFASVKLAPELQTQLTLLDDSANKLQQALTQSPQSVYLIPMLRRTYLQRLQLTKRAIAFNLT